MVCRISLFIPKIAEAVLLLLKLITISRIFNACDLFLNSKNLITGEFDEQNTELSFKEILNYDYYVDDQHLWLNNKQRVNLKEVVVRIEETPFNVETVLRIVEMAANSLPYNAYSKDLLKNYPEVQPVEEENYEKLSVMYQKGELKVSPVQIQSVELMLKNYLEAYKRLACLK